jgi:thiamine kinase-like enzyme
VNNVPVGPGVSCHRDLQHDNVLRDRAGRNWLLDWDNHGPLEPWRELGALLVAAVPDLERIGRLAAAYRKETGTDALPDGPELFATGLAVWLNFLSEQVRAVTHPEDGDEHLAWSARMVGQLLGPFPAVAELARAAAVVSGSRAAGRA